MRRAAYANAYYALALLAYGTRRFRLARRFGLAAIRHELRFALDRRLASLLLKSIARPVLVGHFLPNRRRAPITH